MNLSDTRPDMADKPEVACEHPCDARPRCVLRRTLPGEYLSLALILHAAFGSMVWATCLARAPIGLLVVAAGIWIVGRAAGAFAERGFTPLVTAGLIIATLSLQQQELELPNLGIFSLPVFIAMLGLVLAVDTVEVAMSPVTSTAGRWLRKWQWYRVAAWAFALVFLAYMIVIPTANWIIQRSRPPESIRIIEAMSFGEQVQLRSMEATTALGFFILGAIVGSFLNVVAYRMPRHESVVFQRSRCPCCGAQIKGRDNVPIFGWLLLGGRCRDCQTAISPRYPTVEFITAAIFLLLYFVELISGGANVPVRRPNLYPGVVWVIFYTKWDLVRLYLFHCFALSALLAWALIDLDRQRVPLKARWMVGVILCVLPSIWPELIPVPWLGSGTLGFNAPQNLPAALTSVIGGLSGALLGWLTARAVRYRAQYKSLDAAEPVAAAPLPDGHMASAGMIVGLSVGWQAAVGVSLMALMLRPIMFGAARFWTVSEPPMTAVLLIAHVIHLIGWRWLTVGWWPSYATTPIGWAVVSIVFVSLWLLNRSLPQVQPLPQTQSSRVLP